MNLALLAAVFCQDTSVLYDLPDGIKDADSERIVKIVKVRFIEAKLTGLKVGIDKSTGIPILRISSDAPIGSNTSGAIRTMLTTQASEIKIVCRRELTPQEADKYIPGEKAPPGCSWMRDGGGFLLLEKGFDITKDIRWSEGDKNQVNPFIPPGTPYFEINIKKSPEIDRNEVLSKAMLLVDGSIMREEMNYHHPLGMAGLKITSKLADDKLFGVCINHPLPFKLTQHKD